MSKVKLWPLCLALALPACGVIPTPPVALPTVTLDLPPSAVALGRVIYVRQDVLGGTAVPKVLQQLSVTGTATYTSNGGTLSQVGVYVRSSLDQARLPGSCTEIAVGLVACDATGESGQAIGTIALQAGPGQPFTLSGPALDAAGKVGHGYFGVRAAQGNSVTGEKVTLTNLLARARL